MLKRGVKPANPANVVIWLKMRNNGGAYLLVKLKSAIDFKFNFELPVNL